MREGVEHTLHHHERHLVRQGLDLVLAEQEPAGRHAGQVQVFGRVAVDEVARDPTQEPAPNHDRNDEPRDIAEEGVVSGLDEFRRVTRKLTEDGHESFSEVELVDGTLLGYVAMRGWQRVQS